MKDTNIIDIFLKPGDCAFVPSHYFTEFRIVKEDKKGNKQIVLREHLFNTGKGCVQALVAFTYKSHSEFVDIFFRGILKKGVSILEH